jgi:hypothetical protein
MVTCQISIWPSLRQRLCLKRSIQPLETSQGPVNQHLSLCLKHGWPVSIWHAEAGDVQRSIPLCEVALPCTAWTCAEELREGSNFMLYALVCDDTL